MPEMERQRGTVAHTSPGRDKGTVTHFRKREVSVDTLGQRERNCHTLGLKYRERKLSHTGPVRESESQIEKGTVTHLTIERKRKEFSHIRPERERNFQTWREKRREVSHIRPEWRDRESKCHTLGLK
jgi:hypothetical protein